MSLFCWTQKKIFWVMWETEQFWGTIDFHSIFISYYGSQWCPKTVWLQTFFKISSFVFGRTKKLIQVWNYMKASKWWQNFHFWVNYRFKGVESARSVWNQGEIGFLKRQQAIMSEIIIGQQMPTSKCAFLAALLQAALWQTLKFSRGTFILQY